jgi:hypothetical protein
MPDDGDDDVERTGAGGEDDVFGELCVAGKPM